MIFDHSVAFDEPTLSADGYGGEEKVWAERHCCRAHFAYSKGSEAVQTSGLQGMASFKVKIQTCAAARDINTDYRMRDVRKGVEYQVREVDNEADRHFVWLGVERGVAI